MTYEEFLRTKIELAAASGFEVDPTEMGIMSELNPDYFRDALGYLQAAESEMLSPTLFSFLKEAI